MDDLTSGPGIGLRPPLSYSASVRDVEPTDDEKLRQWQQERLERRLRGEYESATRRLGDVISASLDSPANLADVHIQGATSTRSSFLGFLIRPHLLPSPSSSPSPTTSLTTTPEGTMDDVLRRVSGITKILEQSDIFSSVQPTLERSRSPLAGENDLDLVLKVKERSRLFLKGATETGNGEGSASITARIRNALGGAETLEGTASLGTTTRRAFSLRLEAPVTPTLGTRGEVSVFQFERDHTVFASAMESVLGVKACLRTTSFLGAHELAYEAALRRIRDLTAAASPSIREAAGQSIKSSIVHTVVRDTRNSNVMGTKGYYAKLTQELAGLGGDAHHFKTETDFSVSRALFKGTTLSLSAKAGSLIPLSLFGQQSKPASSLFNDRFQLGGPTTLRMFRHNGLGPKDGGTIPVPVPAVYVDSIGGDLMWAAGISLISSIPRKEHWPLKTHLFLNAGRLEGFDAKKPVQETMRSLFSKPSISAGLGLIYRLDPIRLEVNFGVPLVVNKTDTMRRGFQMGLGVEFL